MSKLAAIIAASIVNYNKAAVKPTLEEFEKEINEALDITTVKVWREDDSVKLPVYGKEGDACCDVYAKSIEYDDEKDRFVIHTGLHFALPDEYEMELRPRSNLTKTEVYMPNSPGTLDWGYRGELIIVFKCRTHKKVIRAIDEVCSAIANIRAYQTEKAQIMQFVKAAHDELKVIERFPYGEGDRVCQLVIRRREKIEWEEVETLEDLGSTERGTGGFGSTGGVSTGNVNTEESKIPETDESPKVSGTNRFAK